MWLSKSAKSAGLVTLITVLIWLYAEGQDITDETREVDLALPGRVGESLVADFADGHERQRVSVTFKAAGTQISELINQLSSTGAVVLPLTPGDVTEGGRANLPLASLLSRARLVGGVTIADLGVSVADVEPSTVDLRFDELVQRNVRVLIRAEGVQLGPNVKIEPAEVTITAPKSLLDRYASSSDVLHVWADLPPTQLVSLPEGVEQTISAPLKPADVFSRSRHVSMNQQSVDVTFTIARQRDTVTVQLVPVWLVAPPSELGRFRVELAEDSRVLRDVSLTGPRDLIDELREADGNLRVIARFELTGDDLERGITSTALSSIEVQRVSSGRTQVLHAVPLNPEALTPGAEDEVPSFMSSTISVDTANPVVRFTITRVGE